MPKHTGTLLVGEKVLVMPKPSDITHIGSLSIDMHQLAEELIQLRTEFLFTSQLDAASWDRFAVGHALVSVGWSTQGKLQLAAAR